MAKPKNIQIEGKDYFGWYYEEQTKIKHRVLSSYAKIWISKLGKYNETMFFDCHAGCGVYIDQKTNEITYGSSFLIEDIAHALNSKRNSKHFICACEIDKKYHDNFQKVMSEIGKKTISLKNADFQDVLNDTRVERYYSNHPTLFFVDPFGYTLRMSSISKMMKNRKNEVIINFMYDFINRFLSVTDPEIFNDFFGSDEWTKANDFSMQEREKFLVDLYKRKIQESTGAKYVYAYRLCFADKDQTYYYLVHATNNIQGITFMKDSFASVNYGRIEYLGKKQDAITFFDLTKFKSRDFIQSALKPFANQSHTFDYIWEKVADAVPYTSKDLSEALGVLEEEGKATIIRRTSKRGQFKGSDLIIFGDII